MSKISILIPTLNNVEHLAHTVNALVTNTRGNYEILIYANAMSEVMEEYLKKAQKSNFIDYWTSSEDNDGIAAPTNYLAYRATGDIICYFNDDIYATPGWDLALCKKINSNIYYQYLTAVMFEPRFNNRCMNAPINFGRSVVTFDNYIFNTEWRERRQIKDDIISPWGPVFITKELWDDIGGFDEKYFPGFGTDPDIVAKIYFKAQENNALCEIRGVADSGLYHFQCVTTDRLENNDYLRVQAKARFIEKWKMEPAEFYELIGAGKKI